MYVNASPEEILRVILAAIWVTFGLLVVSYLLVGACVAWQKWRAKRRR